MRNRRKCTRNRCQRRLGFGGGMSKACGNRQTILNGRIQVRGKLKDPGLVFEHDGSVMRTERRFTTKPEFKLLMVLKLDRQVMSFRGNAETCQVRFAACRPESSRETAKMQDGIFDGRIIDHTL